MARILHVDDKHEWRDVVRRALADHHVDVAGSYSEALDLVQGRAPYDLALVDLHLVSDDDTLGGELLELLRANYAETPRIVLAALPPLGAVLANLFEKFGVEEVLIKSEIDVPDLRRVVEEALRHTVSVDARIRRVELRRRYQEWQRRQRVEVDARVRIAEMFARNTGQVSGYSRQRAEAALEKVVTLRERYLADSADVADRIDRAVTIQEVLDAADALEHVEGVYAELARR